MAYTREGTSSYDPVSGMVTQSRSPMDKAYDDLVSAIGESNTRNSKPRTKASDTSKMNKVYKPKSSPGPASLNLYGAAKPRTGGNSNAREDRKPKPAVPASAKTLNLYGAAKPRTGGNANARENRKPQGRNTKRGD